MLCHFSFAFVIYLYTCGIIIFQKNERDELNDLNFERVKQGNKTI